MRALWFASRVGRLSKEQLTPLQCVGGRANDYQSMGLTRPHASRGRLREPRRGQHQCLFEDADPSRARDHAGCKFTRRHPASPTSMAERKNVRYQRRTSLCSSLLKRIVSGRHRHPQADLTTGRRRCKVSVRQRCCQPLRNNGGYRWRYRSAHALMIKDEGASPSSPNLSAFACPPTGTHHSR